MLLQAVKNPMLYEFQPALEAVRDPNFRDPETGKSPLMYAVTANEEDQIYALLQAGADPDFQDTEGNTALHYAAGLYTSKPLEILLDAGASVNVRSKTGKTPAMEAARMGEQRALELLSAKGADIKAADDQGRTLLHFAAMAGHNSLGTVRFLIEEKGLDDSSDEEGESVLSTAIRFNNTETALYLIGRIPELSAANPELEVFCLQNMKTAIDENNLPVFRALLDKGPELNPEHTALYRFMRVINIDGLYKFSARNGVIQDGKTPLFWAAEKDNVPMIRELLRAGADPTRTDNAGNTPASYARLRESGKLLR